MKKEISREVRSLLSEIRPEEVRTNRDLRRKISFLRKYLKCWEREEDFFHAGKRNPNPFIVKEEYFDV